MNISKIKITLIELVTYTAALQIVAFVSKSIIFENFFWVVATAFILLFFSKVIRPVFILITAVSATVSPLFLLLGLILYPFINILALLLVGWFAGKSIMIYGSLYLEAIFLSFTIIGLKIITKQYTFLDLQHEKPKEKDDNDIYYDYKE